MEILSNLERWSLYWNKAHVAGYPDESDSHPAMLISRMGTSIKTFDFWLNFHEFSLVLGHKQGPTGVSPN